MAKKKVYAALELSDQEIRLVVMEMFDGRTNVLRVEKVACNGIENTKIIDEAAVVKAIQQAITQAQAALGYRIERVLLVIPGQQVQNSVQKVRVTIEDGTRKVRLFHIQQGLKRAKQKRLNDELEMVNVNQILYVIGQETTSKLPVGKEVEYFDMVVDLLYADKELLYSYAKAVESAGVSILDICLDTYALAQETASAVQSDERPIVLLDVEPNHTSLALFMHGKLQHCAWMDEGYSSFIQELKERWNLTDETANRLLQNVFSETASDSIIYIEQQENQRVEISEKQLYQAVVPALRRWIAEINAACAPIVSSGNARYIIAGEGSNLSVFSTMEKSFNAPVSVYKVTSIGARDGAFGTCLGIAYAYEDQNSIYKDDKTSVNNNELEESIESIARYGKDDEGGFTQKLKKVMLTGKE